MKILTIGPIPPPINGCSYANFILSQNLLQKGYKYETINTSTKTLSSNQGSTFSLKKVFSFLSIYGKILKIFGSNIVYFTPGQTFFGVLKYAPFILLSIVLRKPYVIHIHGNYLGTQFKELKGIKRYVFGYLIRNAAAGIALSELLKSNFDGMLEENKVFVVENFVEDGIYNSIINLNKPKDKLKLVYLSNLMKEKGILELLDALIILKEKNIDFEVVLAGKIEESIENDVNKKFLELNDKVKYLGVIEGDLKYTVLKEGNVFVLPTYYKMEGQPISILEALATGNIIVTTSHGGIPDIISHENGLFVKSESVISLAECLEEINSSLSFKVDYFSNNNIEYSKANFTESIFTNKILNIFERIIENRI